MIRESAVHLVEKVNRLVSEHFLSEEISHTIRKVEHYVKIRVIALELEHKVEVILMDVHRMNLTLLLGYRCRTLLVYPRLNPAKSAVEAHRQSLLARNLHAVIFSGIMRSGNLHGCVEAIIGRGEIDHRRRRESQIVDVRTGTGNALEQRVVNLRGRHSAVPSHRYFLSIKQFRQEIAYLERCSLIKIFSVNTTDIISVKCSHNNVI